MSNDTQTATFTPNAIDAAIQSEIAKGASLAAKQAAPKPAPKQPTPKPAAKKVVAKKAAKRKAKPKALTEGMMDDAKAQLLGSTMSNVGELIGVYTAAQETDQADTVGQVSEFLKDAMRQGLTVEMLKAPTKIAPRECYTALVDALQLARQVQGLKAISDATRDNYLSRIRAYVRDRGANPLDLFGNLAAAKAEKERKLAAKESSKSEKAASIGEENDADDKPVSPGNSSGSIVVRDTRGAPALAAYLATWIEDNTGTVALEKLLQMAGDLLTQVNVATGAKK